MTGAGDFDFETASFDVLSGGTAACMDVAHADSAPKTVGVGGGGCVARDFFVDDNGFATLELDREAKFKPGEITLLMPDTDEIHQMDNFTDRPTVEIHVYGNDLRTIDRSRYNLETGKIIAFKSGKYDNC